MRHTEAIELLQGAISKLDEMISESKGDIVLIDCKKNILNSISVLRSLSDVDIKYNAKVIELPMPSDKGHFSEYRIMDDAET